MKILIIDDEKPARERIKYLLAKRQETTEIFEAQNTEKAVKFLNSNPVDVIYLDINLNRSSGFEVLKNLKHESKPIVVFASAHENFALKAFEHDAHDFLLKPFSEERFNKVFEKTKSLNRIHKQENFEERLEQLFSMKTEKKKAESLPIKLRNKTIFITIDQIKYVTADRYYSEVYTPDNKYVLRQSLTNLANTLDPDNFLRVHRSTIINTKFIQEIVHSDYSEIDIKMKDGKLFRVSRTFKKEFLKTIGLVSD